MKPTDGTIRPEEVYRLDEFKRRSGLGDYAFRQARNDGLKVVPLGKKLFVRGVDFVDYVNRKAMDNMDANGNREQSQPGEN